MDDIAGAAKLVSESRQRDDSFVAIFRDTFEKLKGTPRFLLDEAAIHTSVELSLGRPKVLFEAMQHLRVPYPRMWVEWPEAGREKLRETFNKDQPASTPDRPVADRIGFLWEADDAGRRGQVTWFWNGVNNIGLLTVPNAAPISPFFDLDRQIPQSQERIEGVLR